MTFNQYKSILLEQIHTIKLINFNFQNPKEPDDK